MGYLNSFFVSIRFWQTTTIILSVILAIAIIFGIVVSVKNRNKQEALLVSAEKLSESNANVATLEKEIVGLKDQITKKVKVYKELEGTSQERISELEESVTEKDKQLADYGKKPQKLENLLEAERKAGETLKV
jgi:uncharacterized protein involved in exopolysaccharide biosynthesis